MLTTLQSQISWVPWDPNKADLAEIDARSELSL